MAMNGQASGHRERAAPTGLRVGTPQQFRWLSGIVKTLLVLNLLDALFTLVWVRSGLALEANTLIDELVNEHAVGFVAVKLGLVALGSWLLWRRRRRPVAVVGIFVAFMAYYLILLYHVQYAANLISHLLAD
jgi:glucan phosphoethanolaminetransferase (alkaline phosphatase superfamily)